MKRIAIDIAAALILIGMYSAGYYSGRQSCRNVMSRDTTITYITAAISSPVPSVVRPLEPLSIEWDGISFSPDSSSIILPQEEVTYSDTLSSGVSYTATVSGYRPQLRTLQLDCPQMNIHSTVFREYTGWKLSASSNSMFAGSTLAFTSGTLELSYVRSPFRIGFQGGAAYDYYAGCAKPCFALSLSMDLIKFGR